MSEETKKKISLAGKGRILSPENRAKLSAANKGRAPSEATRKLIGAVHKGKTISEYHRRQITIKLGGRPGRAWSLTDRKAQSKTMKRAMNRPEVRLKCSVAKKGKPGNKHSDESKAKISFAQRNLTAEQLANKSASKLGVKNPAFGKRWFTKNGVSKTFTPGTQPKGWKLGRKIR